MASVVTLNPLRLAMCAVSYRRTARASKTADKYGNFFDCCLFAYNLVVRRGNMVQILAQWRRPVALSEALDPLYWSAIEMGRIGGILVCR